MRHLLLFTAAMLGIFHGIWAQSTLHFAPHVPVHRQGIPLQLAWAGGLNFVQLSTVDLNGDGQNDLFLFDRSGNKVITLINNGGIGTNTYSVTRDFDHVHPLMELHDWALLRDYNCDGRQDIFTYSQAGFSVFRNTSSGGELSFEQETFRVNSNYVTTEGGSVIANLFVSLVDLPGIADVDGDGDLDILTFSLLGTYVEYHKNLSMETYGTCDSLIYEVRNRCWGYFAENFSDNAVTLNSPCDYNVPQPEMPQEPGRPAFLEFTEDARAHAGSSVLPIDLEGNGVMDLILGDISFNNMVGLYNGGSVLDALMTQEDTLFPSYDTSVDLPIFPAGFYEDVDNDGRADLIVSPNATSLAQNFQSMWYYKDVGTGAAPVFELQSENLLQDQMLEFGEGAYPVLFDHNNDGLMDLVVANHGYFQSGNTYQGKLALLLNVGTATAPAFDLVTEDYMGLSSSGIGSSMYPAFGDVDGDGDQDMYIGDLQGRIHYYRNISNGGTAEFQLMQANITDAGGNVLDVGQFATPQFHDLDGDGLLDLIVGERNGNLNYYRNTGTTTAPQWTLVHESLGGVSTVEWWNITGHSVPFIFENNAGEREILLGSESGWIYHYGEIEGNIGGDWLLLDSTFMDIHDGARTGVCFYDFDGDGERDLVVGNYRGGLSFWSSDENTAVAEHNHQEFALFPNPATDQVELVLPVEVAGNWVIHNSIGQEMRRARVQGLRTIIDLRGMPSGVYHIRLEGDTRYSAGRSLVIANAR